MNDEYNELVQKYKTFYFGDHMEEIGDLIQMLEDDWIGGIWYQNRLLVLVTKGLSRNEWIIKGLFANKIFWDLFWEDSTSGGIHRFRISREWISHSLSRRYPEPRYPGLIRTVSGAEIEINPNYRIVTKCNTCPITDKCDKAKGNICPVDIEIFPEGAIILRRDGDRWLAHDLQFIDLQISHHAYGESPQEALERYISEKPKAE